MLLFMLIFLSFIAFILQSSLKSRFPSVRIYGPLNKIPSTLLKLAVSICKSPSGMVCWLLIFSHRMEMEMTTTALPEITAALCSYSCIFYLNCSWHPVSEGSRVYRLGTVNWIDSVCEMLGKFLFVPDEDFSVLFEVSFSNHSPMPIRNPYELIDLLRGQLWWNLIHHGNNIFREYMFISFQERNSKIT